MQKTQKQKDALLKVNKSKRLSTESWIEKARDVHGDKYDYSITTYQTAKIKLDIICPKHGVQTMLPHHHIKGYGCGKCGKEQINISSGKQLTQEQFIDKIKHIEGLSFEKTIYKNRRNYITVTCDIHGDYKTKAEVLLKGCGCPKCKSSKGESSIRDILNSKSIYFFEQMTFPNLKIEKELYFDFYIPQYNCCIEYDGKQHFKSIKYWGGELGLKRREKSDNIKNEYCRLHNIPLLRIKFDNKDILGTINDFLLSLKHTD